jgi:CheY-specific phosphatase CheX
MMGMDSWEIKMNRLIVDIQDELPTGAFQITVLNKPGIDIIIIPSVYEGEDKVNQAVDQILSMPQFSFSEQEIRCLLAIKAHNNG